MKRSLSKLFVFILFINISSLAIAETYENHGTFLILIVLRLLQIPPQTQITFDDYSEPQQRGEVLELSSLINKLLKEEDVDEDEEIEIRNPSGQNFLLPIDDLIFRNLPHAGRGIVGRYLMREENGSRQHIFDLVDGETFATLHNTYLEVESLRSTVSNFELLFTNPSYFAVDDHYHNLEDLPNHYDYQSFYLEDDGLRISGEYSRRYEHEIASSSSTQFSPIRENFDEVIEFEKIEILNSDESLDSLALVLYPRFASSDPDAEAFLVPSYLSLKAFSFKNRHVIFHRYNNLEHLFEIIRKCHDIAPIHYLEFGFHANEYSFDMRHRVRVRSGENAFKVIERNNIQIQNCSLKIFNYIRDEINPYLNAQTKIVLNACLTGALGVDNNLVDVFSRLFPENEVSGPICIITVDGEGSDILDEGSWSYNLLGVGSIPVTYNRLYRTTADLRDFRLQIEQMFFEHLTSLRSNFIFFHPEKGLIHFQRSMISSLINSITRYSQYYTKRILNVFVGRIYSDALDRIHVINPGQDLIAFLNRNAIQVDELHQLDSEHVPISGGLLDVELHDGFLRQIPYDLDELSTDTEEESSSSERKRKREEDLDEQSKRQKRE